MIIVCGRSALQPDSLRQACIAHPHDEVYALPWVTTEEGLTSSLKMNRGKPMRVFPCERNTDPMEGEGQDFDENLDGDALGRMAHIIAAGFPSINEVMKSPCESPFYGKVLTADGAYSFLLDCEHVDKYFPHEPLSAKLYAATTALVRFKNTEQFIRDSGCESQFVDIILASDFLPGSVAFMQFYRLVSGRWFVGIRDLREFNGQSLPCFRYNRGYRSDNAGPVL